MYDPGYCPKGLAPDRAFCILGRDGRGEVVATHAACFYDVDERDTLYDVATSSRMFYDDPERMKLPGERCEVTAEIAAVDPRPGPDQRRRLVPSKLPQARAGDDHAAHGPQLSPTRAGKSTTRWV